MNIFAITCISEFARGMYDGLRLRDLHYHIDDGRLYTLVFYEYLGNGQPFMSILPDDSELFKVCFTI